MTGAGTGAPARPPPYICTTFIPATTAAMGVVDFPVVFLDKVSMSMGPVSLIPVMNLGSRHLAFTGDHKLLPLVITSRKAKAGRLGVSLFERTHPLHHARPPIPHAPFPRALPLIRVLQLHPLRRYSPALLLQRSSHLAMDGVGLSVIFLDHARGEGMKELSLGLNAVIPLLCTLRSFSWSSAEVSWSGL
ncbi:hypothetical protein JB92DRAFT_2838360 [Gautieria morchelliformis]|nr:hypothetical protein JB92DRAFT_2838360 [Gautieria morchelliformis]